MPPSLSIAARRAFLFRFLVNNSNKKIIQRGYAGAGPDPELMKIHNVLPPNYKSFSGQMVIDHPAFFYDWVFKKQVDPNRKIPEWSYRTVAEVEGETYVGPYLAWKLLSAILYGWIFWRLYWGGYWVLLGEPEFTVGPKLEDWTDEELGIPNDDTMPPRLY